MGPKLQQTPEYHYETTSSLVLPVYQQVPNYWLPNYWWWNLDCRSRAQPRREIYAKCLCLYIEARCAEILATLGRLALQSLSAAGETHLPARRQSTGYVLTDVFFMQRS